MFKIQSLSGKVINSKNEKLHLDSPTLVNEFAYYTNIIWKINVKKILHTDCFIKFIVKDIVG